MSFRGTGRTGALLPRATCAAAVVVLAGGCNTVLDNQPGELAADGGGLDAPFDAGGPVAVADAFAPMDATTDTSPPFDAGSSPPAEDSSSPSPAIDSGTLPTCALGQDLCNGSCVSSTDPLFGCGASTCTPCSLPHATTTCGGSGCAVAACDPGYADCNQTASDGCETDLSQSATCGTCNAQCGAAAPYCTPSGSSFTCVSGCSGTAPTLCGNQCVDLTSALDNCGTCGTACPSVADGQATCANGACGFVCQSDFHDCGTACASDSSPNTCGTSCAPCPTGPNAIPSCNGAQCGMECQPGYANCNGLTSDGCEVTLATNPSNCGTCGTSCPSGMCVAGACVAPPPPPDAGSPPPVDAGSPPPVDASVPPEDSGSAPPPVDAAAMTTMPDASSTD